MVTKRLNCGKLMALLLVVLLIAFALPSLAAPEKKASAAEGEDIRITRAAALQDIGAVFEVHFFLNYEYDANGTAAAQSNATAAQEEKILLNGYSLRNLREMYYTVWFYVDWRVETDTDGLTKRTLVVSIAKMHPYGFQSGENTLTLKAGLITPDNKEVNADSSLNFTSGLKSTPFAAASVLDQGSIGYRYLIFEFELPRAFSWADEATIYGSVAGYIFVNGQRLETITGYNPALVSTEWERASLANVAGAHTYLDVCFNGLNILKEGENTVTIKQGMSINWGGHEQFAMRYLDRDYTFKLTVTDGDANDTIELQEKLRPDWSGVTVPQTAELDAAFNLPAEIPAGDRTVPIRWSESAASKLGEITLIGSIPFEFGESVSKEYLYKSFTVNIVKKTVVASDIVFPTQTSELYYGQTLAECMITQGTTAYGVFDFPDPNVILSVGTHKVTIRFYPTNDKNYNFELGDEPLESTITVIVKQNHVPLLPLPDFSSKLYRAGEKLSSIALPEGFAWEDPDESLAAGSNQYRVICTVPEGQEANYYPVVRYVTLNAEAADAQVEPEVQPEQGGCGSNAAASCFAGGVCLLSAVAVFCAKRRKRI